MGAPAGVDGQQAGGEVVNVQIIKQFKIHEQGPLWEVFGSGTQRCIGLKMVWDTLQGSSFRGVKGVAGIPAICETVPQPLRSATEPISNKSDTHGTERAICNNR